MIRKSSIRLPMAVEAEDRSQLFFDSSIADNIQQSIPLFYPIAERRFDEHI